MIEKEIAEERAIIKMRIGSHLYGTNTETSDEDFAGVFIPSIDYLLGIKRMEEVDAGEESKDETGKNTKDAIDYTLHSLTKFARLAAENNPNILEMLFVNKENLLLATPNGQSLLDSKKLFISKRLKHRFLGYAFNQKHKMIIKLENYEKLLEAANFLNESDKRFVLELIDVEHNPLFIRKKDHVSIGDINIPITSTVKKAKALVDRRLASFGSRTELVTKHGFDVKFGSHLIRLILEGIELLETGNLIFPLSYAPLLLDIKNGKYSLKEVLLLADEYEKKIEGLYESSPLPNSPNFKAIEDLVISIHLSTLIIDEKGCHKRI